MTGRYLLYKVIKENVIIYHHELTCFKNSLLILWSNCSLKKRAKRCKNNNKLLTFDIVHLFTENQRLHYNCSIFISIIASSIGFKYHLEITRNTQTLVVVYLLPQPALPDDNLNSLLRVKNSFINVDKIVCSSCVYGKLVTDFKDRKSCE